jgi:threonine/homoserine/homoserine lactone efflux protein
MRGELFAKGLAFGFVLAATVGPMWVLCLRRTLARGVLIGFASGMGIAVADAIYGAIAAFGLTAISGFLLAHSFWIGLAGAAFLLYLGAKTLAAKPSEARVEANDQGVAGAFWSTLGLTLTNPPTILAFAAIFAALGLASNSSYSSAGFIVLGVFIGSAAWWVILAAGAGRLRERIGRRQLRAVNVVAGLMILGFAAWQIAALFR